MADSLNASFSSLHSYSFHSFVMAFSTGLDLNRRQKFILLPLDPTINDTLDSRQGNVNF